MSFQQPRSFKINGQLKNCDRCDFAHARWIEMRNQNGLWLCPQCVDVIIPTNNAANPTFRGSNVGPMPTCTLTAPVAGSISGSTTFSATTTGNVVRVAWYAEDEDGEQTPLGADQHSPYSISVNVNNILEAGADYTIYAIAYDILGNEGVSSSVAVNTAAYHYGYPAYGTAEPHVIAQWAGGTYGLGATSNGGSIIDAVSAITIPVTGTPTYQASASGLFSGVSPGITFSEGNCFLKDPDSSMALGTSHAVFECWFSCSSAFNAPLFNTWPEVGDSQGLDVFFQFSANPPVIQVTLQATDNSSSFVEFEEDGLDYLDGTPHKIRIVMDRNGDVELFADGIAQAPSASPSLSAISGKTIPASVIGIGCQAPVLGNSEFVGTIYEMRLSVGSDVLTNNSGGVGGG